MARKNNKNGKENRFVVTRSLRMPSKWMKGFFCGGLCMAAVAVILALICLVKGTKDGLGVAVVLGLLSIIWIFMVYFNSANNYGVSMISFNETYIKFYYYEEEYKLAWEKVSNSGIEKTRLAYWVYLSDHELSAAEKKEFPENAKEGVMYYGFEKKAWEEMMKYAPESVRKELEEAKANTKIK